jgi:NAD(P)-dependent dehydrogenase (short-subunit alcohol dehydrogenase family)
MGELRFDGRVAIVTGAGTNPGLGRAYAMLLASRGSRVLVNDLGIGSDGLGEAPNDVHAVASEITAAGGEAIADVNSVAGADSARAIVQAALDAWGRVDILINNAGVSLATSFDEITDKDVELTLDVNLMGSIWMCRAVWPAMRAARYGRIVNTTSGAMFGERNLTVYGAAKAGNFGLSRGLALEGAPDGIKVNAVGPGAATAAAFHHYDFPEEGADLFKQSFPPEAVAAVVGYLAHESCAVSGALVQAASGRVQGTLFGHAGGFSRSGLAVEDVAANIEAIFDPDTLELVTDPENPASAERDTEGSLKPKPYRPT